MITATKKTDRLSKLFSLLIIITITIMNCFTCCLSALGIVSK
jgi:hypothetical protein